MSSPKSRLIFGIFVPVALCPRKGDNENVIPAIAVKIVGKHAEILGISCRLALAVRKVLGNIAAIKLMPVFEVGTFVPEVPDGNIEDAVVVEIANGGSFCVESVGQDDLFPAYRLCFRKGNGEKREE